MLGKIASRRRKADRGGEMVGRHHQLNEHESEQTPRERKDREAWHAAVPADAKSWK